MSPKPTDHPTRPQVPTRNESRYLDGELPPDVARRLERQVAADPQRGARLAGYREAMDVWRDDASRAAHTVDTDALAARVVDTVTGASPRRYVRDSSPWYAVAAMALITVGVTGTFMARAAAQAAYRPEPLQFGDVEATVLDVMFESAEPSIGSPKLNPK